jgi:hypothetical protein
LVVIISVPLLGSRIRAIRVIAGLLGVAGSHCGMRSTARLDALGVTTMLVAVVVVSIATVLT